ncbi:MAG: hypothetical protein AB1756_01810 [Acidobacteriota bacterium]
MQSSFCILSFIISFVFLPSWKVIQASPVSGCDGSDETEEILAPQSRCVTIPTGEVVEVLEKIIDDSHRTIAVPWPYPRIVPTVTGAPPTPSLTGDPAWTLMDTRSIYQRLKKSEYLAIQFDHDTNMLLAVQPFDPLTAKARQAVDKAPAWMQKELEESFSRLDSGKQDTLADLILNATDPYVDEIAWGVAHISTSDLTNSNFYTQLITDNAQWLYKVDADVDYAEIINYGNSVDGGDYYSTVRYKVDENGTINEYEYPRDIYYWYIVHPRGSDEIPTYIDPDAPCSGSGTPASPPNGRFWREYFYGCDTDSDGTIDSPCPTYFGQCDNDHDGTKDGPCPLLKEWLQNVHVLWAQKKDTHGPENGAVGQVSEWVHRILGKWGDKDGCRPIQPVTIYYYQDGNCGEYQDMQTAAGRAALIPTIGVSAHANDHVWNEFYERRWIEWQAEDKQIDHPEGHDGWTGGLAAVHAWRGDGYGWTDQTANYTSTCQLVVTITDANGYPVDGARVKVASEPYNLLCDIHLFVNEISRGHTDENGRIIFTLGDNNAYPTPCRKYYVNVHTDWGDYPASGYALVIDNPQPNMTYYWSYQFTNGSVPRLSVTPATEPPDPTIDNLMEVTYSVTDEYLTGDGFSTGITYREDIKPGNLDFFIADSYNYSLFTSGSSFQAFEIAIDSPSGNVSFIPPATDDWYATWSNKAAMNLNQVIDTTVRLYSNNGYIPPVCNLIVNKGSGGEAILDWEDLSGINMDAYNVYRSMNAADVGSGKTKDQLAPFLIATVQESTYTDSTPLNNPGDIFYYTVRTLGKSGEIADECTY